MNLGAIVLAVMLLVGALSAGPAGDAADVRQTLYFHSDVGVGSAEQVLFRQGVGEDPTMDAAPPSGAAPKASHTLSADENARKSQYLPHWTGAAHGVVSNAVATVWVQANVGATLSATLFGDAGGPLARVTLPLAHGQGGPVVVPFPAFSASVDKELVVSFYADTQGATILYDSTLTPSSLSFDLAPYAGDPPAPGPAWTPAPGWGPVRLVSASQAGIETSLAIDPTDEAHLATCAPSGVPALATGQSYFHRSTDRGASWAPMDVETSDGDLRAYAFEGGDCDVAFDAAGTMYVADTWLGDLSVGASHDGGATWTGTPVAVTAPAVDRPWLVAGAPGVVHLTYQDLQCCMPSVVWYTLSTDHGRTFRPAVPVTTANADGAATWQGNFVVSPDGDEIFTVQARHAAPLVEGAETVWVTASRDAGITWTSYLVASMPAPASFLYPTIAMDDAGGLHVAFSSPTATDQPIWYAYSADGARTWSAPTKLLAGISAFSPWIAARDAGTAVVAWYGTPATTRVHEVNDWYVYTARVAGAGAGAPTVTVETTTTTPLFRGAQDLTPEFITVRLDAQDRMVVGAAAYYVSAQGRQAWAMMVQAEE